MNRRGDPAAIERRFTANRARILAPSGPIRPGLAGDRAPRLIGLAAVYGAESALPEVGEKFVEVLARGCFDRTLREMPDVRCVFNDRRGAVLGRAASGTLRLRLLEVGLGFEVSLPETDHGRSAAELVARGDVDGCSIGFNVVRENLTVRADGTLVSTLVDVDLFYVGPATFPGLVPTQVDLVRSRLLRARAILRRRREASTRGR